MKAATNAWTKFAIASLGILGTLALGTPARADVIVSPSRVNFGTQLAGGTSSPVSVTLTNTGSRRVRFSSAFSSVRAFVYAGPTTFTLQPKQTLTVSVTFQPGAAQTYTGYLMFRRYSGGRISVPLYGTGASEVTSSNPATGTTTPVTTPPVTTPPSITSQPGSQTVIAGQTASFSVGVSGTSPFTYQWTRNGAAIGGANASSYAMAATTSDTGAQFAVVVSNSAGNVTSNAATLTVNAAAQAPSITSQPVSKTVTTGQTASFTVGVSGTSPFTYQWLKNGAPIGGATAASYTMPATTTADSGAQFAVTVSNSAGNATSNAATLTVNAAAQAPSITSQPGSKTVISGQTASFTVGVTGTSPFSYQWKKNGAAISGATASSYTTAATTAADSGAQYTVSVNNSAGAVTSNAATLTVNAATLLLSSNSSSLSFGNVDVSTPASLQARLTSTGTGSVTISGVSVSGAGFTASGLSSGQIIAPAQSATVTVTFDPSAAGGASGSLTVTSNAAPVNIALSGAGVQVVSHSVLLSWTRSTSTVSGYQVYSAQVSGGPYNQLTSSPVSLPNFSDGSVQNGKTYYYVVTAVDSSGVESNYSPQAAATIQ